MDTNELKETIELIDKRIEALHALKILLEVPQEVIDSIDSELKNRLVDKIKKQ